MSLLVFHSKLHGMKYLLFHHNYYVLNQTHKDKVIFFYKKFYCTNCWSMKYKIMVTLIAHAMLCYAYVFFRI